MAKAKKTKKAKRQSGSYDARQLNVFIFLAGLSYAVFLVFSKLNRLQDEVNLLFQINRKAAKFKIARSMKGSIREALKI